MSMTAIRATLLLALVACLAWGQQVAEHHSEDTAVRSVSWPIAPTATPPHLPMDGRMTQAVRPSSADRLHAVRVRKAERIVGTFADYRNEDGSRAASSFYPYCEALVSYCEEVAEREGEPGFADTWYYALVYGFANFGLRCYAGPEKPIDYRDPAIAVYPGIDCTGPFDVKKEPPVIEPVANMRHHVDEQFLGWRLGYRGRGLCEYVMYPARPHDWGGGRFCRTDRTFRECIAEGYRVGKLP